MQADNYFKVVWVTELGRVRSEVFPFIDADGASVSAAWQAAARRETDEHGRIAVYRRPLFGMFHVPVIGDSVDEGLARTAATKAALRGAA